MTTDGDRTDIEKRLELLERKAGVIGNSDTERAKREMDEAKRRLARLEKEVNVYGRREGHK